MYCSCFCTLCWYCYSLLYFDVQYIMSLNKWLRNSNLRIEVLHAGSNNRIRDFCVTTNPLFICHFDSGNDNKTHGIFSNNFVTMSVKNSMHYLNSGSMRQKTDIIWNCRVWQTDLSYIQCVMTYWHQNKYIIGHGCGCPFSYRILIATCRIFIQQQKCI